MSEPTATRSRGSWRAVPRPFLKWVGGKAFLLSELQRFVPERYGTYHEPFVGGGAMFFHLKPERAVLTDRNDRLVRTYLGIRDQVEAVIEMLDDLRRNHSREQYLDLRDWPIDDGTDVEVAAWMVYLNKTGFNGLYRVNSRNVFNVPFGKYPKPSICDPDNLRACAEVLQGALIHHAGFEAVADAARPGDLVYFDPPYAPVSPTANFTSYTKDGFGPDDQARLAGLARALRQRGVTVVLSNSDTDEIRALYADGPFTLHQVMVPRAINAKASGRGKVPELIIA